MNLKFYKELRSLLALKRCNPACPTRRLSQKAVTKSPQKNMLNITWVYSITVQKHKC